MHCVGGIPSVNSTPRIVHRSHEAVTVTRHHPHPMSTPRFNIHHQQTEHLKMRVEEKQSESPVFKPVQTTEIIHHIFQNANPHISDQIPGLSNL